MTGATGRGVNLTLDSVRQMASEMIADQIGSHARDAYAAGNMSDLPATYRQMLPAVSDRRQLAEAEQLIRKQYQADMRTEVPKHIQRGAFLGTAASPQAMEFHQTVGEANAALQAGDLDKAQQLLAAAKAIGDPNAAATEFPPDFSKMSATDKIEWGLKQEREARGAGTPAARPQPPANSGAGAVDTSRLTAGQKILMGLQQEGLPWRR